METSKPDSQEKETQQDCAEDLIFQGKFSKALEIYQLLLQNQSLNNSKERLKYAQILDRISLLHFELCQYSIAYDKCLESFRLKTLRNHDYDDNMNLFENYLLFGKIYRAQGNYKDALIYYKKYQDLLKKHDLKDVDKLSDINYELGLYYSDRVEFNTALENFNSCIDKILTKGSLNSGDNVKIGKCYQGMAKIYRERREYEKSKDYYEKAKDHFKELGLEHPVRARLTKDFGHLLIKTGDYDGAIIKFEESLAVKLKNFEEHIDIASSYSGLSRVALKEKRFEDALVYEKKAAGMLKKFISKKHPRMAVSYHKTGDILLNQGEREEALKYLSKARKIFSKVFSKTSPFLAPVLMSIGSVYKFQRKYFQALEYYQESIENIIKNYGEGNYLLSVAYKDVGLIFYNKKNYDGASEYYQKSLDIKILKLGENHPEVAYLYHHLGLVYDMMEEYEIAKENYNKALSIRLRQTKKNPLEIANTYYNMAIVNKLLEDYRLAIMHYRESMKYYMIHWGPCHSDIVETAFRIGSALKKMKQFDEAATYFKIAYTTQKKCKAKKTAELKAYLNSRIDEMNVEQQIFGKIFIFEI